MRVEKIMDQASAPTPTPTKRRLSLLSTQCWQNIIGKESEVQPMPKLDNASSPRSTMSVTNNSATPAASEDKGACPISQLDESLFEPIALVTPPKKRSKNDSFTATSAPTDSAPLDFRSDLNRMFQFQNNSIYNNFGQIPATAMFQPQVPMYQSTTDLMSRYAMAAALPQHGFSFGAPAISTTAVAAAAAANSLNSVSTTVQRPPSASAVTPVTTNRRASLTAMNFFVDSDELEPFLFGDIGPSTESDDDYSNTSSDRCPDLCASTASLGSSTSSLLDDGKVIISTSDSFKGNNYAKAEVEIMNPSTKLGLSNMGTRTNKKRKNPNVTPSETEGILSSSVLATDSSSSTVAAAERDAANSRFKPFHEEKWNFHFRELLNFKKEHGHCLVPHTFPSKPHLARWVKRQRRQYKLKLEGNKNSTMTEERIKILNDIGFVWDSHEVIWNERFAQLVAYKQKVGHCRVPSYCKDCPQLASWVKCQRRQYKLFWEDGKSSSMNMDRIKLLDSIGFIWEVHPGRKKKESDPHYEHLANILMDG